MHLRETLDAYQKNDPAARSKLEVLLLYNGLHAIICYRISHWLWNHRCRFLARLLSQIAKWTTGVEIHPAATIGRRLVIDHGTGIVVGATTEIGDDCLIYQGVTLGGTGKDSGKRHPTIGNNVLIGSGAKVLGPFRVGDNARIASGAVVLREVPPNCTAVGVPAHVARLGGKSVHYADDVDQINVKDPVEADIVSLAQRICQLEQQLKQLQTKEDT